jgi:hypothetical protein
MGILTSWFRVGICAAAICSAALPNGWTDRSEYDLVLKIREEASAQKRLVLLEKWKSDYPKSEQRQVRNELFLTAYQSLGDHAKMLGSAREILAGQPDSLVAAYWCALLAPEAGETSPEMLALTEKAAQLLLSEKPAAAAGASWEKQKTPVSLMAHRTLGWVYWQRKEFTAGEKEFTMCLELNAKDARSSAWLGALLEGQAEPEKQSAGLWHLARAASLRDEEALPEGQRRQLAPVVDALYRSYHGSEDGLDGLKTSAGAAAFPPQGFAIESAASIAAKRAEEELAFRNPQLAAWRKIRKQLEAPDGEAYFSSAIKGQALPKLKGTVVRSSPAKRPTELGLALNDSPDEEVTLKLSTALSGDPDPGLQIFFTATGEGYSTNPFRLTLVSTPDQIENWPARGRK